MAEKRHKRPRINGTAEERAWYRGYTWAIKNGYDENTKVALGADLGDALSESIRDCRMIAMAYAMGYKNGRKSRARTH
jgi:hypothetical protein